MLYEVLFYKRTELRTMQKNIGIVTSDKYIDLCLDTDIIIKRRKTVNTTKVNKGVY